MKKLKENKQYIIVGLIIFIILIIGFFASDNQDLSVSKKTTTKLPQTGVEMVSIVAIIALGAISISSYVSYRKYKNI